MDRVPGPIYRIPIKIADAFRAVKYKLQRIFRKSHASDPDLYNLNDRLAEIILPKLKAFRDIPPHGYPMAFSEYEEPGPWPSHEEYEKAKAEGKVVGGGMEAWLAAIEEMIFGFEYILVDKGPKYERRFFDKYGYDWHAEIPENLCQERTYENPETGDVMVIVEKDAEPPAPWVRKKGGLLGLNEPFYYNAELHTEATERAKKGLELFGKYLLSLWD